MGALLDHIVVNNHGGLAIRSYHFDYLEESNSHIQQLQSITECNGSLNGTCLPATTFSWSSVSHGLYGSKTTSDVTGTGLLAGAQPLSLNGDSFPDMAWLLVEGSTYTMHFALANRVGEYSTTGAPGSYSFQINEDAPRWQTMDVDGDGLTELLVKTKQSGSTEKDSWKVVRRESGSWIASDLGITDTALHTYDVTGDGRADILYRDNASWQVRMRRNNPVQPSGFDSWQEIKLPLESFTSWDETTGDDDALMAVINQDALEDLPGGGSLKTGYYPFDVGLAIINGQVGDNTAGGLCQPNTPKNVGDQLTSDNPFSTGLEQSAEVLIAPQFSAGGVHPYDFNGDGMADLLMKFMRIDVVEGNGDCVELFQIAHYYEAFIASYDNNNVPKYESWGLLSDPRLQPDSIQTGLFKANEEKLTSQDVNGDGYFDLLYFDADEKVWKLRYSDGTQFLTAETISGVMGTDEQDDIFPTRDKDDYVATQLADVTNDGRADLVYYNKPKKRWYYHTFDGATFGEAHIWLHEDLGDNQPMLMDVDGDGLLGMVQVDYPNKDILVRRDSFTTPTFKGRIRTITSGFGAKTTITYTPMSDSAVYTKGTNGHLLSVDNGPVYDLPGSGYLVSSVSSELPYTDAGGTHHANNTVSVNYHYQGLRIQGGGRGSLGFETIKTTDPQTGVKTVTTYSQVWPTVGMPLRTVRTLADGNTDHLLSDATNTLATLSLEGGNTVFPYIQQSVEKQYTLQSDSNTSVHASTITTTNSYDTVQAAGRDNHANLRQMVVRTARADESDIHTVTTTNSYDDNVDNWWLARLTASTVIHQRTGQTDITRKSGFEYDTDTGMLSAEIIEPDSSDNSVYLKTAYTRDAHGNITAKALCSLHYASTCGTEADPLSKNHADGDEQRIYQVSRTTYDAAGRYPVSTANAKYTLQTVKTRNAFGQVSQVSDTNGVTMNTVVGTFGQPYFTSTDTGSASKVTRRFAADAGQVNAPGISETYYYVEQTLSAGQPTSWRLL